MVTKMFKSSVVFIFCLIAINPSSAFGADQPQAAPARVWNPQCTKYICACCSTTLTMACCVCYDFCRADSKMREIAAHMGVFFPTAWVGAALAKEREKFLTEYFATYGNTLIFSACCACGLYTYFYDPMRDCLQRIKNSFYMEVPAQHAHMD